MKMKMKMKMKMTLQWLLLLRVFAFRLADSLQALSDTADSLADSIRIDCGAKEDYIASYQSDDKYVEYGEAYKVPSNYTKEQIGNQLKTLRSFPEGKRNCYTLPTPNKHAYYLVRAFFAYGNYDNESRIPTFDLYIGVTYWATFNQAEGDIVSFEVIHVPPTDDINVCLVNTGHGTPFISLLEVLPWPNSRYDQTATSLLRLMTRCKLGMSENVTYIRYSDDIYERSWRNKSMQNSVRISTSMAIDSTTSENTYKLPKGVLSSAVQSVDVSSSLVIDMDSYNTSYDCYVYLHFYDFVNKSQNQQRKMVVTFSDGVDVSFTLEYLIPTTLVRNIKSGDHISNISIRATSDSQLPAMLNAYEIYRALPRPVDSTTDGGDVAAIRDIKKAYGIKRISWQGDPCMPVNYTWEGLTCYNNGTPRITSINLSSSNLTGEIARSFSNFTELKVLDLSNNSLTGKIPESLAVPENLKDINLTRNKLKGPIPKLLADKKNAGKLNLSTDNLEGGGISIGWKIGIGVAVTTVGSVVIIIVLKGLKLLDVTLRFEICTMERSICQLFRILKKRKKGNERRGKIINDEERRRSSGKKEDDDETDNNETPSVRIDPNINIGEAGSESILGKVSEAIQQQISDL